MSTPRATVCCLLYGDHPELAGRCLTPVATGLDGLVDLRLGLNAVSGRTRKVLEDLFGDGWGGGLVLYDADPQVYKYPMMRRMLRDPERPIRTPWVLWFDDDSCVADPDPAAWLGRTLDALEARGAAVAGHLWGWDYLEGQEAWQRATFGWHRGVPTGGRCRFATGGWLALDARRVVEAFDWPPAELVHNGGDVLLGELCRQQGLPLVNYTDGLWINADAAGRPSKAPRRGRTGLPAGATSWRKAR